SEAQQKHLDEMDVDLQKNKGFQKAGTLEDDLEENKELLTKAADGEKVEFDLKAPAAMTVSFVTGGNNPYIPNPQIESGLNEAPRIEPNVMTFADVQRTSSAHIVWINKVNEEGNAAFIGEGELKP